ncbi:MAG TPA: DUF885 family protein, partial [Woeseiaceae bacterium]|nr:DUF885 family protein [Woeseiaceae bacterium]
MIRFFVATLLILIGNSAISAAPDEFAELLHDAWEWQLRESPVMASSLGDRRYNGKWADSSLGAIEARQQQQRDFMQRLLAIDSAQLDDADQLNYELFRRDLMADIEGFRFRDYLMPINQRGGVQTLDEVAERIPLASVADYDDWLQRMASIEIVIDQTMALQEEGRARSYMPPKILMQRVPDQVSAQLVENAEDSPFYKVFRQLPDSIPAAEQERLRTSAKEIIEKSIVPAYRKFSRYFNDTYLPASRDSIDASSLPDG